MIFWQLLTVTVVLSVVSLFRRITPNANRQTLLYLLVVALLGSLLPNNFPYLAAAELPAGVMGIVITSVPMFSLGIALGISMESLSLRRGLGVGAAAVVLSAAPRPSCLTRTRRCSSWWR